MVNNDIYINNNNNNNKKIYIIISDTYKMNLSDNKFDLQAKKVQIGAWEVKLEIKTD